MKPILELYCIGCDCYTRQKIVCKTNEGIVYICPVCGTENHQDNDYEEQSEKERTEWEGYFDD
jgi:hypothetical protein